MDEQFSRTVLFPIIRSGLGLGYDAVPDPEKIDFNELAAIGKKQSVLPMIRQGLSAMQIKGEGFDLINRFCLTDIFQYANRDHALESVCRCFEDNAIPYVLLKGSVIRDLYPEKWMRTSCDIDVLIHEEDTDRACALLESGTGFKKEKQNYHDVCMKNGRITLELHFKITETMDNIDALLITVWDHCERSGDSFRYVMSPEFTVFHTIAHMAYHMTHGGLGVRPYVDLWLLRNKTDYDGEKVASMCSSAGILKYYENACLLSDVWLGNARHTNMTEALERYSFDGGVFGSGKKKVISKLDRKGTKKSGYLLSSLFLKKEFLEILYPNLKKHPVLLPFYQVKRWINAIVKKRSKIRKEMKLLGNTTDEEIRSQRRLLDSLGL